jgi:hypothetical protein
MELRGQPQPFVPGFILFHCSDHAGEEGNGIHEDIVDTVHMIRSDGHLAIVLVVQMFGLLAYNYAGTIQVSSMIVSVLFLTCLWTSDIVLMMACFYHRQLASLNSFVN